MNRISIFLMISTLCIIPLGIQAADKKEGSGKKSKKPASKLPKVGDTAPDIALKSDEGKNVKLSDYKGKNVVVYFYPRDMTPGCTKESCDFRDKLPEFQKADTAILGISTDSVESHKKFKEKYKLTFPLLADTEGKVSKAYGVLRVMKRRDKSTMLSNRATFLINKEGKIAKVWGRVNVNGHAKDVLGSIDNSKKEESKKEEKKEEKKKEGSGK